MTRHFALGWSLLVSSWAAELHAVELPSIYDNRHAYPIGSRAAGMAGAYTALACDEAALHYNVASLACAGSTRLELAVNAYEISALSVPNAFGTGQNASAITYHSIPSAVGTAIVLRNADDEKTGAGRLVFGFAIEVPRSLALKLDPSNATSRSFVTTRVRDALLTADLGIAYQLNRYVALGAGIGGALHTLDESLELLLSANNPRSCVLGASCFPFYATQVDLSAIAVGLHGKAGIRITPTPEWSLGFMVTSPTIDVYGRADGAETITTAFQLGNDQPGYGAVPRRAKGKSDVSLPLRLALGAAYSGSRFSIALDASLDFPRSVGVFYQLEEEPIAGVIPLSAAELASLERRLELTWQTNVNLGAEVRVSDGVALDFGAFTDLSAVHPDDVSEKQRDRLHMFGGTFALAVLGNQIRSWFGISAEGGASTTRVLAGNLDFESIVQSTQTNGGRLPFSESTLTRWTLAGFIGSNYSFAKD
jgi:hypothetical protein